MAEYIERDKAIEKINAYCELRQAMCLNDKDEFLRGLQTALKAISYNDVIPNADVQPVKHGKWENTNTPNQLRCSRCDVIHFIAQYPHGDINYCPNCGADMRGDDNGQTL